MYLMYITHICMLSYYYSLIILEFIRFFPPFAPCFMPHMTHHHLCCTCIYTIVLVAIIVIN